jgi:DNA polymerase-4
MLPMSTRNNRILHIDGDSFFASCEIALNPRLEGRPVWVGGGRRGDGIVIAANRLAKKYGIKTGTACFEAKRLCPSGVLCKPHYDAYRELSRQMFLILEEYSPTLVPYSIDEGFLDFSTMETHMWRNTTATDYVQGIRKRILKETRLPVTAGLANSAKLAKLATDAAKGVGFLEVPPGREKDFLNDRPVQELSGIAKNRQRSLAALGALTFGHVAKLPSMLLKQKFGIWGQQLWLFSNGQWNEPLVLEIKDRTTISSSTTLPQDEHDYEAALTFMLSESTRLMTFTAMRLVFVNKIIPFHADSGHSLNIAAAWISNLSASTSSWSFFTPRRRRTFLTAARTPAFTSSRWGFVQSTFRFFLTVWTTSRIKSQSVFSSNTLATFAATAS